MEKTIKEYNAAMKLWKLGTGGGSGAPENYCDWETRDGEYFATYGDDKDNRKDYLAWIYVLDQQMNYAFDTVNDPAPDDTVTEDSIGGGSGVMKGKKGQQLGTAIEKFGERMSVNMTKGIEAITRALVTPKRPESESSHGTSSKRRRVGHVMVGDLLSVISELGEQMKKVEAEIDAGEDMERNAKIMNTLKNSQDKMYEDLVQESESE